MSREVAGIPLSQFEEPIKEALDTYQAISDNRVLFDTYSASHLELTADKPNSARSSTPVMHLGEREMATLHVIAFAPGDSTGNPSSEPLYIPALGEFQSGSAIMPRSKEGVRAETHLTIATAKIDYPQEDPMLFAGSLSLLGPVGDGIGEVGVLGQQSHNFVGVTHRSFAASPTATLTTGIGLSGERFGDPHAVYNGWNRLAQVCAFLAISEEANQEHLNALRLLHAAEPINIPQ